MFKSLDKNGDGVLSITEISEGINDSYIWNKLKSTNRCQEFWRQIKLTPRNIKRDRYW